jgi:hypothetical protein
MRILPVPSHRECVSLMEGISQMPGKQTEKRLWY